MPRRPPSQCHHSGCTVLTHSHYCDEHQQQRQQVQQQKDAERGSAASRGYGYRWRKARDRYLKKNPLCVHCLEGKPSTVTGATVVDHKVPHKGSYQLMWDESNWQPLCKRHHDIKTATEDGGFGR